MTAMRTTAKSAAFVAVVAVFAGCSVKVNHVTMDTAKLESGVRIRLECDYFLKDVVDVRPLPDNIGGLGRHMFALDDAAGLVRERLSALGLSASPVRGSAVKINILRFYVEQSYVTKIPVVVYEVAVGDALPFVVRSQKTSMNWNGSEREAYKAYAQAIDDVNARLFEQLNLGCRAGSR